MKKGMLLLLISIMLGLTGCKEELPEEHVYESPYAVEDYSTDLLMNDLYYKYHNVYAGKYFVDGTLTIALTEDAPEELIARIEEEESLDYDIVQFSSADLFAVREILMVQLLEYESFRGISTDLIENCIVVQMAPDSDIPEMIEYYIEIGIVRVQFSESEWYTG